MCSQQRVCCLKIQLIKLALCEVEEVKFVCASNSGLSEEANAGCGLSRNIEISCHSWCNTLSC